MTRSEMKEIICRIIKKMQEESDRKMPAPACIFGDGEPCDATTKYAVDEER